MGTPFLSEVKIISFGFAPRGWAFCNGQLLPINQNQALFSLLGTTYGGDGQVNFALPDLRGRVPIHMGSGHVQGERAGNQSHTVIVSELPQHVHIAQGATENGDSVLPTGNVLGSVAGLYGPPASLTTLAPASLGIAGGSQAHLNMQPFLALNFCIALQGAFPSQN